MASLRNRKSFSSPALEALLPPPIPTGKGSLSAADPAFSECINNARQVPELILPDHVHLSEPAEINYQLLLLGDDDSVNRLLRSAANHGGFQISGHGISTDELKSTLSENQWVFEQLGQTRLHCAENEEVFFWRCEIAEKIENIFGDKNLRIFCQNINKVARELEEIAEELAPVIGSGEIKQLKRRIQTSESTLVLHRYRRTAAITNQLPLSSTPTNGREEISSKYTLSLHLLLEPGGFFSRSEEVGLSFLTRPNIVVVTIGEDFEPRKLICTWSSKGQRADEFKNAIENLKFKPKLKDCGALFSIELRYLSSDASASDLTNSAMKFSLADQILTLLLLAFLYRALCFLFS